MGRARARHLLWLAGLAIAVAVYLAVLGRAARSAEAGAEAAEALAFARSLAGLRVVLDPGHGGRDPGATGPGGVAEAELNLELARALGSFLTAAGATVLYTRTGAEGGDLLARAAWIEEVRPDVVVSLHCNATTSPAWRGAQTFFDGPPGPRREASRALAREIQHALRAFTPTRRFANSGIAHYILERSPAPAVTVEAGFLTNPDEARLLMDETYRRRLAFAVFLGLARWAAGIESPDPTAGLP